MLYLCGVFRRVVIFIKFARFKLDEYYFYAKVNSLTNIATVKVLRRHNFLDHLPQVDLNLLERYGAKMIVENNKMGMIFKWTT